MSIKVSVDWSRNGTFTDFGDDVTLDVRRSVNVQYGRDQSTALTPSVAGRGNLTLDNTSRRYSPRNASSLLYGKIKPARPVLITRTIGTSTYVLFAGHTDDQPINPDASAKTVGITLVDYLADFRGVTLSTSLYSGIRTGTAIGYVLDAAGWTGGRDLDPGATVMPWWWEEGTDALTALQSLVNSEGPPALLTVDTSGGIVFRDRHHRLTRTASTTSQGTWRGDGPIEPVMGLPFSYDEAWRNVVNSASVSVDVRVPTDVGVVWSSTSVVDIAAGATRPVVAQGTSPFFNAIPPTGTDIVVESGTVTTALTRTSGGATTILLTAGGSPARVTSLQLRATPIPVAYTTQVQGSDATSIATYGTRSVPFGMPHAGVEDVQAVVDQVIAQRADPLPVLSVTFNVGQGGTRAAAILSRNLSDRVTVIEPETQISADFHIESIAHSLTFEGDHVVTVGLEAAPTTGLDSPSTIFMFDTAGHGFDQGVFAH